MAADFTLFIADRHQVRHLSPMQLSGMYEFLTRNFGPNARGNVEIPVTVLKLQVSSTTASQISA
jgi:hypothetical protein